MKSIGPLWKRWVSKPKKFIMFTDGYPCGSWGDADYCDTLFVVKGNTSAEAPFGQTVIYEKDVALWGRD